MFAIVLFYQLVANVRPCFNGHTGDMYFTLFSMKRKPEACLMLSMMIHSFHYLGVDLYCAHVPSNRKKVESKES